MRPSMTCSRARIRYPRSSDAVTSTGAPSVIRPIRVNASDTTSPFRASCLAYLMKA